MHDMFRDGVPVFQLKGQKEEEVYFSEDVPLTWKEACV